MPSFGLATIGKHSRDRNIPAIEHLTGRRRKLSAPTAKSVSPCHFHKLAPQRVVVVLREVSFDLAAVLLRYRNGVGPASPAIKCPIAVFLNPFRFFVTHAHCHHVILR